MEDLVVAWENWKGDANGFKVVGGGGCGWWAVHTRIATKSNAAWGSFSSQTRKCLLLSIATQHVPGRRYRLCVMVVCVVVFVPSLRRAITICFVKVAKWSSMFPARISESYDDNSAIQSSYMLHVHRVTRPWVIFWYTWISHHVQNWLCSRLLLPDCLYEVYRSTVWETLKRVLALCSRQLGLLKTFVRVSAVLT